MSDPPRLTMRVKGELACFSRPEFKVERASYPWITPSAARAVFEAVLWKPAIRWEIRTISLLEPIRYTAFRRNEINMKIAPAKAKPGGQHVTDTDRAQRNTVALRDVDYLIEAELHLTETGLAEAETNNQSPPAYRKKFEEMFLRRLNKGQQFTQPYLGCREFAASVFPPTGEEKAICDSMDHGWMLYDIDFAPCDKKGKPKGRNLPMFYQAKMERGVIDVPPLEEVRTFARGGA